MQTTVISPTSSSIIVMALYQSILTLQAFNVHPTLGHCSAVSCLSSCWLCCQKHGCYGWNISRYNVFSHQFCLIKIYPFDFVPSLVSVASGTQHPLNDWLALVLHFLVSADWLRHVTSDLRVTCNYWTLLSVLI